MAPRLRLGREAQWVEKVWWTDMIFANSRYANAELVFVTDSGDAQRKLIVEPEPFYATSFVSRRHVTRDGQRMDQLASFYYNDPEMWWVIAVANPEVFYPDDIPAGTVMRIPDATPLL